MESPDLSVPEPDIMNDPAWDPEMAGKEKEDPDTCRICRGEGSPTEPLFYPCKCSGSIKFVHQDCLMEWLSHSQKKHCELCKTSFRFTKLYHPQMPSSVPIPVFLKQAGVHALNSLLTWARWNLVIFVWLGWVPWCMRTVWRGLFWIGDGGWITAKEIERQTARINLEQLAARGTSPAHRGLPLPTDTATSAIVPRTGGIISSIWRPVSRAVNLTSPTARRLARGLYLSFLFPGPKSDTVPRIENSTADYSVSQRSSSLLSEFTFLKNLTRISTINNLAIDVLEGQLITLAVVVVFILIFLIREWVVQQQPALNAGPGLADAQNENQPPNPAPPPEAERPNVEPPVDNQVEPAPQRRILPMPVLRARPNIQADEQQRHHEGQDETPGLALGQPRSVSTGEPSASAQAADPRAGDPKVTSSEAPIRPSIPDRDVFARTGEIRRTLEEQAIASGQSWPGIEVFMDVWKRAGSNPDAVLEMIREEGREEELGWIVAAMRKLQARPQQSKDFQSELDMDEMEALVGNSDSSEDWSILTQPASEHPQEEADHQDAGIPVLVPISSRSPFRDSAGSSGSQNHTDEGNTSEGATQEGARRRRDSAHSIDARRDSRPEDQEPTAAGESATETHNDHGAEGQTERPRLEVPPQTLGEQLKQWLWGEVPDIVVPIDEEDEDDGHIVDNLAEEPPFVPVAQGQPMVGDNNVEHDELHRDPEVLQAAAEAGLDPNDPEAAEDGEDLEGVMELIGMQGPIAGLVQNGMFSAVLISMSLLSGIWVPYVTGKATLVLLANPISVMVKVPLRWVSTTADTIVDTSIFFIGWAFCCIDAMVRICSAPIGWVLPFVNNAIQSKTVPALARKYTWEAAERLKDTAVATGLHFSDSDVPVFSIIAHESLLNIRQTLYDALSASTGSVERVVALVSSDAPFLDKFDVFSHAIVSSIQWTIRGFRQILSALNTAVPSTLQPSSMRITLDLPQRTRPLDYTLAHWGAQDRVYAILFGYLFFFASGIVYLKIRDWLWETDDRAKNENSLVEVLNQAGGVAKVILIISIEMIAFPLYCGILLDTALLPLFENATVSSRLMFTMQSPATSVFVHWFVGTCYMFHFALFVSMCRKITRTGVLYFIRDPDDPSFHPVRDVLERNVYTQLRKIAFSAMVYGALVIICLGTIVWGISLSSKGIFPIRWSSNRPVLDFPVDLLAYNFLMPIAIKFFRPSKGLNTMYEWWFRKCAGWLRLTHFLFDERKEEEEGHYLQQSTAHGPPESRMHDEIEGKELKAAPPRFVRTGRFVRAPASDQVRLPKGSTTFVDVDDEGNRLDGKPETDQGLHGRNNQMFSTIYIPPSFRLRIASFIILLWLFAACTGVGVTIIPLTLGRAIFSHFIPSPIRMNDIYAFAIGTYLLGGPLYLIIRYRHILSSLSPRRSVSLLSPAAISQLTPSLLRGIRLAYFYLSFTLLLPSLLAMLFEAYLLIPLHTYTSRHMEPQPKHTVHLVQDWTLGVLALKLAARILLAHPTTRPAQALRALVSPSNRGASWSNPDVRLATRAFVLPAGVVMLAALSIPVGIGRMATLIVPWLGREDARKALVYRYAYPALLGCLIGMLFLRLVAKAMNKWRSRVRDEVYLIGERLHNFGEKRTRVGSGRVDVR